jgi:hypothetical protein
MTAPRWPELRAALIALAIVLGVVDGLPIGKPPPLSWIEHTLRVSQNWGLFAAPGRDRFRMSIEGQRADGTWQILFRAGDRDHADDAEMLLYRRVRGVWDPTDQPPAQYVAFAEWEIARMLARHPELVAVRVWMEPIRIGDDGALEPSGRFVLAHARTRQTQ